MLTAWEATAEDAAVMPAVQVVGKSSGEGPAEGAVTRTVLEREAIGLSEERDLNGVLGGLPGLTLQATGTRTALSGLSLRGASAGLGQITLDGLPLYSSILGASNLSGFPADAVERVEVVRGAVAPRYGSRALGGVIRLSSRDGQETGLFSHLEGGSYGSLSETLGGSWAGSRWRGTLTASRDDLFDGPSTANPANGNTEGDNFWSHQALARLHGEPADSVKLDGTLLYNSVRFDGDAASRLPDGFTGLMDDAHSHARAENWAVQTTASVDLADGWASRLQLGYTSNRQRGESRGRLFGFDQHLLMSRWTNTHTVYRDADDASGSVLNFVWGGEARQEEGGNLSPMLAWQLGGQRTTLSGVTELQGRWGAWSGFLGTTIDHYEDFGTHPTLYAGFNGWVLDNLQLRASGGHGYRAPTLKEWYFVPAFGNPRLKPEQGWSADVGVDWLPAETRRVSLTGFYSHFRDMIRVAFAPDSPLLLSNFNIPRVQLWGFELEGETGWDHGVKTGMSYTYTHGRDLDTGFALVRQPAHQGRIYGAWRIPDTPLSLWMETVYRSGYSQDLAQRLHAREAVRINAQLAYHFSPKWQVYVRGENLADDRTEELFSFTTRGAAVFAGFRGGF